MFVVAMSNKRRVYIALYRLQNFAFLNRPRDEKDSFGCNFHWAIVLQRKQIEAHSITMDIKYHEAYANRPKSEGWKFHVNSYANLTKSPSFLGMVMVGKVPKNIDVEDIVGNLRDRVGTLFDGTATADAYTCKSWTVHAMQVLQEMGCVEDFDLERFVRHMDDWGMAWRVDRDAFLERRLNYTKRKM